MTIGHKVINTQNLLFECLKQTVTQILIENSTVLLSQLNSLINSDNIYVAIELEKNNKPIAYLDKQLINFILESQMQRNQLKYLWYNIKITESNYTQEILNSVKLFYITTMLKQQCSTINAINAFWYKDRGFLILPSNVEHSHQFNSSTAAIYLRQNFKHKRIPLHAVKLFTQESTVQYNQDTKQFEAKGSTQGMLYYLEKQGICLNTGYPISNCKLINLTEQEIINFYYKSALRIQNELLKQHTEHLSETARYIISFSLAKTLAHKYKTTTKQMFIQYSSSLKQIKQLIKS